MPVPGQVVPSVAGTEEPPLLSSATLFPEVAPAPPCPSPPESESLLTSCSIPTSPISHSTQLSAHILVQENTLCWSNLAPISSQGRFTASGAGQGEDTATPAWTESRKVPDWETVTQWTLGELGGRFQKMADSWGERLVPRMALLEPGRNSEAGEPAHRAPCFHRSPPAF